ncbi:hypothetical protein ABZV29_32725 [Streptomyces sp. NPDC005236]|uniref:hypothetical protein n=1 Tax=Streptomyces sp. NPDC005236 TaxID=3157028 RepID=UPI0033AD0FE8
MNNLRSLAPFIGSLAQSPHTYPWRQLVAALGVRSGPRSPGDDFHVSATHVWAEAV